MWSHLTWFRISMTALQVKSPLMTNVDTILQIMWFQKIQSTIWQNQETGEHWWNLLKSFLWMLDIDDKDRRSRWENLFAIEQTGSCLSLSLWERDEALTIHKTRHGTFMKRHFVDWICLLTIFDIIKPLWNLNHDFCAFFGQYGCKKKLLRLFAENSNFQTVLQIYFLSIQSTLQY